MKISLTMALVCRRPLMAQVRGDRSIDDADFGELPSSWQEREELPARDQRLRRAVVSG